MSCQSAPAGSDVESDVCTPDFGNCECTEGNCECTAGEPCQPEETLCATGETRCPLGQLECEAVGVHPAGHECRTAVGVCDAAEVCDGSSNACPADQPAPTNKVCREAATSCDLVEFCTGAPGKGCPEEDQTKPAGAVCEEGGKTGTCANNGTCVLECVQDAPCDIGDACQLGKWNCKSGVAECVSNGPAPSGTSCRPSAGACDIAESCDGTAITCPTDAWVPADAKKVCRASQGTCDEAETCDGFGPACPVDVMASADVVCRAAKGGCDAEERCEGNSVDCPADDVLPAESVCREATNACDLNEVCDGVSAACPKNDYAAPNTPCGAASGECKLPGVCNGTGTCLPETNKPNGEACGSGQETLCSDADTCWNGLCEPNHAPQNTPCGGDASSDCKVSGVCDGAGACQSETSKADGTPCGNSENTACSAPDTCMAGVCVPNNAAAGFVCGTSSDPCKKAPVCNSSGLCLPAENSANDTPCDADNDACTVGDACQAGSCLAGPAKNCTDDNVCTAADCSGGVCSKTPVPGACDDGNDCTVNDSCTAGQCAGTDMPCDDQLTCTQDSCSGGDCTHELIAGNCLIAGKCYEGGAAKDDSGCIVCDPAKANDQWTNADGEPCQDGDPCTTSDSCDGGECVAGSLPDCSDGNPCTTDACVDGGCVYSNLQGSCDDGDACTSDDACQSGVCKGTAKNCNDNEQCTLDSCVDGDCIHSPTNGTCDDGNACTEDDTCGGGTCVGTQMECDDGKPCTTDTCSGGECQYHFESDGNFCFISGICVAKGGETESLPCKWCDPLVEPQGWTNKPTSQYCTTDNPACEHAVCVDGTCQRSFKTGTACDDGDGCTENDTCSAVGACGGVSKTCDDGKACTLDMCVGDGVCQNPIQEGACLIAGVCYSAGSADPANSCKVCAPDQSTTSWTHAPGITACDDGDPCTLTDTCSLGECVGTSMECDDNESCTVDSCEAGNCVFMPTSGSCDDGDACTENDVCSGGTCFGLPKDCVDGLACTTDGCSDGSCTHDVVDGACLIEETCYTAGQPNPQEPCAICAPDVADVAWSNNDNQPCDDDTLCTLEDTCVELECRGTLAAPHAINPVGTILDDVVYLLGVTEGTEGQLIIAGASYADGTPHGLLLKTDQYGHLLNAKRVGTQSYTNLNDVAAIGGDGNYIAVGTQFVDGTARAYYQIFDDSLNVLSGNATAIGTGQLNRVARRADGRVILVGETANIQSAGGIQGRLVRMSTAGAIESNTLHFNHATAHVDVISLANNATWVAGHRDPAADGERWSFLRKSTDGAGLESEHGWDSAPGSDRAFAMGVLGSELIVGARNQSGQGYLRRFSTAANTWADEQVPIPDTICTGGGCDFRGYGVMGHSAAVYVFGLQDTQGARQGWVGAFDPVLNPTWEHHFGSNGLNNAAEDGIALENGLIAVIGGLGVVGGRHGYVFFIDPGKGQVCGAP